MTALQKWRRRMGISQRRAADLLGLSLSAYQQHETERSWRTGEHIAPDLRTLLAAAAIEAGLPPVR